MVDKIYAQVVVNVPQVRGVFDYLVPPHLASEIRIGSFITVPFRDHVVQGVVARLKDSSDWPDLKTVQELIDPLPVVTPSQIALAEWMSESTLSPLAVCLGQMLPDGLSRYADTLYELAGAKVIEAIDPLQQKTLALLKEKGALRGRQIDHALPRRNWQNAARNLERKGVLTTRSILLRPAVHPKSIRTVNLLCPPNEAQAKLASLQRQSEPVYRRRSAVIEFLAQESIPVDITWVYAETGCNLADLERMEALDLIRFGESQIWRDPLANQAVIPVDPPVLTQDQNLVWQQIEKGLDGLSRGEAVKPFLLQGVTGSGKTELYLRAIDAVLKSGRQAIVLVPEIALTPQMVRRLSGRFPGAVGLVHSRLSPGENYDTWRRVRSGALSIVVGPRSALFMPFPKLGLIVLDECHDESYYQEEISPCYNAVTTAVKYTALNNAICILGSATPDVCQKYAVDTGRWQGLSLPARILAHRQVIQNQINHLGLESRYQLVAGDAETIPLPPVHVVDMREELKAGHTSILSRSLEEALKGVLSAGQQAILYLNRRGKATYVFCRDCGYSLRCPRCETPLTAHEQQTVLMCHYCGYQRNLPAKCPQCQGTRIRQYGTGTERLEQTIKESFPEARTIRWDADTTREKGAHDIILSHFTAHRADVLIGTQMVAKGLDLPWVTLVGIVLADVGLNLPDYRGGERTFQLLTQVAGRAGRSPLGGQVVLQTFQPENYAIRAAAGHDFAAFYEQELAHRRRLGYPPFYRLVRLEYRHLDNRRAEERAMALAAQIQERLSEEDRRATELLGPLPCFFAKRNGLYRWQIVLRGPDPPSLLAGYPLSDEWHVEVDPPNLL